MNPKILNWILSFLFISLFFAPSWAQENEGNVTAELVQNSTYSQLIYSNGSPSLITSNQNPQYSLAIDSVDVTTWSIAYTPNATFLGKEDFVIRYFKPGGQGQSAPGYISYRFDVLESVVTANNDFVSFTAGDADITVDVLSNDETTASSLSTVTIVMSNGGTATVNGDNTILFVPDETENFIAFVDYVAKDNLGGSDLGSIIIQSDDTIVPDTMSFTITNEKSFSVILPDNNCSVSDSTLFGELEIQGTQMIYSPDQGSDGIDQAEITNGNVSTIIEFDVIDLPNPDDFVKDDFVFLPYGVTIEFDAFENDLENDGAVVDYSSELVHLGDGEFSYTPDPFYQGSLLFYYTVWNGFENQTANIFVSVDNQIPNDLTSYTLDGLENQAIVLDYDVPIVGYDFEILQLPTNGVLSVLDGLDTFEIGCNEIQGYDLIIYEPNQNFIGTDEFDLRYFVNGSQNSTVKVKVDIHENDQSNLCHCVGPDCVWPGDINNDGRVSVDDLLPLGLYMGEVGEARNNITYDHWNGQSATDWNDSQGAIGENLKFVDADGDGYVTIDDKTEIEDNYDYAHALFTNKIVGTKDYGLELINLNGVDTVYQGDVLCLGLKVGTEEFPLIDQQGLAINLNINPDIIDSSSTVLKFYQNSWFTYNSSQMDLMIQPIDGKIDLAVTRSGGSPITGSGLLGEVCFIVEEDANGFKGNGQDIKQTIGSTNVSSLDGNGNYFALQNASLDIFVGTEADKTDVTNESLIVYPNPTSGLINLHLNGGHQMEEVYILDMQGQVIDRVKQVQSRHLIYDTTLLNTGVYVARTKTTNGWAHKLFKVISE